MAKAYEILVATGNNTPQEFTVIADSFDEAVDKVERYRGEWRQNYALGEIVSITCRIKSIVLT